MNATCPVDQQAEADRQREIRSLHGKYPLSCNSARPSGLLGFDNSILAYITGLMEGRLVMPPQELAGQWDDVLACLWCHWICPVLFKQVMSLPRSVRPPPGFTEVLKYSYLNSMKGFLISDKQLADISDAFEAGGIEFLALKGAALARTMYPDRFTRPCCDIDILVRPGDVSRARVALETAGYACKYPNFDVSRSFFCEEVYHDKWHGGKYIAVELHWNLTAFPALNRHFDIEDYFRRSIAIRAGNRWVSAMDAADSVIYLSTHLMANHSGSVRLSWINDIALLCRHLTATNGWEELSRRVFESGTGFMIRPVLRMAELWTGVTVPGEIRFPISPAEKAAAESLDKVRQMDVSDSDFLGAKWPAYAPFFEKCRIFRFLMLPPELVLRTRYFPGQDLSLPLMHLKRWASIVARNLRR